MEEKIDWGLIHLIQDTLDIFQEECGWDLDSFELIKLTKSFYNSCRASNRFFSSSYRDNIWTDEKLSNILKQAFYACWGENNTCSEPNQKEINTLKRIFDPKLIEAFSELDWHKYT